VKLTTHLHLVPRLRTAELYLPTPMYVFIAWCLINYSPGIVFALHIFRVDPEDGGDMFLRNVG
jgi:hypothetical protein